MTQFDLSQLNLGAGTHSISVRARAVGYITSDPSSAKNYYVYSVTGDATHATIDGDSEYSSTVAKGKSKTIVLSALNGYRLPASIKVNGTTCTSGSTVNGCRYTRISETAGSVVIESGSQNIALIVEAIQMTYSVKAVATNVLINGQSGYNSTVTMGDSLTLALTAESGHTIPQTISVNGKTCQAGATVDGAKFIRMSNSMGSIYIASASMNYIFSIVGN